MFSTFHIVAAAQLLVHGALSAQLRSTNAGGQDGSFFSYDYSKHGQDWTHGSCSSRSRQSPIDLSANIPVSKAFSYKYNAVVEPFEVMNNGHAFSIDFAGLGYGGITYENAWYYLLNINVHSLSEHTWNGQQMPLEIHMVHKRYDGDAILVVAVPVESPLLTAAAMKEAQVGEEAAAQAFLQMNNSRTDTTKKFWKAARDRQIPGPPGVNPFVTGGNKPGPFPAAMAIPGYASPPSTEPEFNKMVQAFLDSPPPPINMKTQVQASSMNPFNLNTLLEGGQFYDYAGSLTAPPCAEVVTWLVRKDSVRASDTQVMYLHDAIYKSTADFGNFRSLMPLNGREVILRQARSEEPPLVPAPQVHVSGKEQQSDREYRAMRWAMDAMTMAKSATAYVKDLDGRLRDAAQAHANALAPTLEPLTVNGQVVVPGAANAQQSGQAAPPSQPGPSKPSPMKMEKTAEQMARTLATAAKEEIEDATREISKRSKEVAMEAAREAANQVMAGAQAGTR